MRTLILAALTASAAVPAAATVYDVTVSGTTENVNDTSGVFGTPGATITNAPFTASFRIDSAGATVLNSPGGIASNNLIAPSPHAAVTGSITINGQTFSVSGTSFSSAFADDGSGSYQLATADAGQQGDNLQINLELDGAGLPTSVLAPANIDFSGLTFAQVSFFDYTADGSANALGTLTPSSVTAAVPEPAMAALAGLGVFGLALRRRSKPA